MSDFFTCKYCHETFALDGTPYLDHIAEHAIDRFMVLADLLERALTTPVFTVEKEKEP